MGPSPAAQVSALLFLSLSYPLLSAHQTNGHPSTSLDQDVSALTGDPAGSVSIPSWLAQEFLSETHSTLNKRSSRHTVLLSLHKRGPVVGGGTDPGATPQKKRKPSELQFFCLDNGAIIM